MTEWFDTFFDALAHDVWDALVTDDASDQEADWIARSLGLDGNHARTLLDVPSGRGRLATRIAGLGHDVVAVDFAEAAVTPLAASAPPRVTVLHGDMRDLDAVLAMESFDGAWCMGNSFGYLDAEATDRFLAGMARALRPQARFLVDASIAAEALLPHLDATGTDRHVVGDVSLTNTHHYEVATSTLVTRMTLERAGERDERVVGHRVLTCREIVEALDRAGFELDGIDGDLDGSAFTLGSSRCLVRALRR